jgi:predicted metal-dependent hydrolase
MQEIAYQGKTLPIKIGYHSLKKSRLEIRDDYAHATLCYDLSTKQQNEQLGILKEKLYKHSTKNIIEQTLLLLQQFAPRTLNGIRYKKLKSRWGSASDKNNLNFNVDIAKLPLSIQQYIAIHEYCHLFEMNHSPRFWAKVSKFDPNYKEHRRQLRRIEKSWIAKA